MTFFNKSKRGSSSLGLIEALKRLFKRKKKSLTEAYRIIYKKRQELELISARIEAKASSVEERARLTSGAEREIYLQQRETLKAIVAYVTKIDLYLLQVLIRLETLISLNEALEAIKESNAAIKSIGPRLSAISESYGELFEGLKDAISGFATVSLGEGPSINLLGDDAEKIIDTAYDEIIKEADLRFDESLFENLAEAV